MYCGEGKEETEGPVSKTHVMINQLIKERD
jgi:hypothetical protein